MTLYIPSGTPSFVTGAVARIERRMPQAGEVLVRMGQRVEPDDIVARAFLPSTPVILNLARMLMIAPSQVGRRMRIEEGNKVAEGEVLARSSAIGGRVVLAPVSGIIAAIDRETGYVTISPDPVSYDLQATVRGLVMDVFPGEGVRIETPAAQVYGAFGVGRERSGVLRLLVTDPSEPITPEMIDARSAYAIIIGGNGITAAALRRAVAEQVRGVIVGGIDERELRQFLGDPSYECWRLNSDWRMPAGNGNGDQLTIVVTEGFGEVSMSAPLFELLAEHDRQEALIGGTTTLRSPHTKPRVIIPLSSRSGAVQLDAPQPILRVGAAVRLLDREHLGQTGRVRQIPTGRRRLASGVSTQTVDVQLDDGRVAAIPRTAVEVLS